MFRFRLFFFFTLNINEIQCKGKAIKWHAKAKEIFIMGRAMFIYLLLKNKKTKKKKEEINVNDILYTIINNESHMTWFCFATDIN